MCTTKDNKALILHYLFVQLCDIDDFDVLDVLDRQIFVVLLSESVHIEKQEYFLDNRIFGNTMNESKGTHF